MEQSTERNNPSPDILASLPTELQHSVLTNLRQGGGIQCLFPPRQVSRQWCRVIDEHLYTYFIKGPDTLYCYVNLWNRFRQKLIQQRVTLRLRVRTLAYTSTTQSQAPAAAPTGPPTVTSPAKPTKEPQPSDLPPDPTDCPPGIISWQPSSSSSGNPSLSPRIYNAYIYDACFDAKYATERPIIHPIDINPRTPYPISLGSGLTRLLERANQPPRSGTIFPLFHVIQEAWDFILGDDAALMPIYPPIASEAWLQIRLATGSVAARYREPPSIYIEPTRDPFWPFRFDEYSRFQNERYTAGGQHQFAVVSRLALPNLVEDEGILLVTVRDTSVDEWIHDTRYREIMQSMITVADSGGPQEFILGGAVVQLEDYERFIPKGMVLWFRRRILERRTRSSSPNDVSPVWESPPGLSPTGVAGNVLSRLERAMDILRTRDGIEFPEHEAFLRHIGRRRRD
jgi:hypothetical protein